MAKRTQAKGKTKSTPARRGTTARSTAKRRTARSAAGPAAKRSAPKKTAKTASRQSAPTAPKSRRTGRVSGAKLMGQLAVEQKVPVDAIRLLEQDHREVEALFAQFKQLEDVDQKQEIALKICLLLTVHTQIEEEILYPAAREAMDEDDLVDEAEVEHGSARSLIAQIEEMAPDEHLYDAKVKVLGEYIHHHVEEEETEFFPELRDTGLDMMELGGELAARRVELLAELTGKG